jgi:hypothetical protein
MALHVNELSQVILRESLVTLIMNCATAREYLLHHLADKSTGLQLSTHFKSTGPGSCCHGCCCSKQVSPILIPDWRPPPAADMIPSRQILLTI